MSKLRISHIVDWSDGQAWTALIRGNVVIARYTNMRDAQTAAAAPEMAEALRAVLANHTTAEIEYFPALSLARAVLAKAGL